MLLNAIDSTGVIFELYAGSNVSGTHTPWSLVIDGLLPLARCSPDVLYMPLCWVFL